MSGISEIQVMPEQRAKLYLRSYRGHSPLASDPGPPGRRNLTRAGDRDLSHGVRPAVQSRHQVISSKDTGVVAYHVALGE